jgi:hypothetical protein
MSKKKTGLLIKIVLCILILLVVLVAVVIILIDPIAKNALEKGAPLVLGTNASVERIHIEPFNGRVEITNLIIDNPSESYSSDYAIKLGDIVADIKVGSVFGDKIHVEDLTLKEVDVVYETTVINSNLQEILENVKKLESKEKAEEKEDKDSGKEKKEQTLQVDKIELENVGITVQAKGAVAGLPIHVSIDPMGPLGEGEEGITPVGLTLRILGAIVTTAIKSAGGSVTEAASVIGDATADAAAGAAAAAVDAASGAVDAATGAIKGLFGGSKDDNK